MKYDQSNHEENQFTRCFFVLFRVVPAKWLIVHSCHWRHSVAEGPLAGALQIELIRLIMWLEGCGHWPMNFIARGTKVVSNSLYIKEKLRYHHKLRIKQVSVGYTLRLMASFCVVRLITFT